MENREANSHCSPLYAVAGQKVCIFISDYNVILFKWAKILVPHKQNDNWGISFDYCN